VKPADTFLRHFCVERQYLRAPALLLMADSLFGREFSVKGKPKL
jgi:hypothetical protein